MELLKVLEEHPNAQEAQRWYGAEIYEEDGEWYWADSDREFDARMPTCPKCGHKPTWCESCRDYHDACLGHVAGATDACCGHGLPDEAYCRMRYTSDQ